MATEEPERPAAAPFELGPWRVDPGANCIAGLGGEVVLEPRAIDVLVCLAHHAGETVGKDQLLDEVWRGAFVSEGVVAKTISELRHALGDEAATPRFILTVARRGYRLVAPVRWLSESSARAEAFAATRARLLGELQESPPARIPPAAGAATAAPRAPAPFWALAAATALGALLVLAVAARLLRSPRELSGEAPIAGLAVAPFAGEPESLSVASALRDELVTELVRRKPARIFRLEAQEVERHGAAGAARRVGADTVALGRVRGDAATVAVDLQLVAAESSEVLWSERFERPVSGLFALRGDLSGALLARLRGEAAAPAVATEASTPPPIDGATYRKFLEARFLWSRRGVADLRESHRLFGEITREAEAFAPGFAWLALSCVTAANYGLEAAATALPRGESAARRAVALDSEDPVAYTALGLVTLNFHLRADEAIASYRQAIELAPSFASAWQFLAEAWSVSGHHKEAIAAAEQAVELEPFSPVVLAVRGLVLQAAHRPREALEALDQALLLEPRFNWIHRYRAYALTRLGQKRAAAAAFVAEVSGSGERGEELAELERLVAERDVRGYWEWRLDQLLAVREGGRRPTPTQFAEALAAVGRKEEALAELARAPAALDGEYFLHYRESPAFDALRSDLRFTALYAQFGL